MVEMIWKEPPPSVSSRYAPVLAELKKFPGRWALVQEQLATATAAPWKKLGCEARAHRTTERGETPVRYDIYARWPISEAGARKPGPAAPVQPAALPAALPAHIRPAGGGTYDPGLGRAARGVPADGLPVTSLRR